MVEGVGFLGGQEGQGEASGRTGKVGGGWRGGAEEFEALGGRMV